MAEGTSRPVGINHVVLNVRDIEESHKFWTEIVGLKQVGALHPRAEMGKTPRMQFYSGDHDGKYTHHDVALVERSVLTAGSSWHAAGGFHALNANPNMALLQAYTIDLLKEVEAESGQSIGMHMTGGIHVASAPERWEWLQASYRRFQAIGIDDVRLVTP